LFLEIVQIEDSYKLVIDRLSAKSGNYVLNMLVSTQIGNQIVEQNVEVPVFIVKNIRNN